MSDSTKRIRELESKLRLAEKQLKEWNDNAEFMLTRWLKPWLVRVKQNGGPENKLESLVTSVQKCVYAKADKTKEEGKAPS